ncbi:hypothetical protein [Cohnella herbarum]|uniref:Uncharacterized protein n=1 Tax=Cohnella herbarum TaxID=2728023 RepID=A0A7Z2ZLG1_9BACL|nr:hypothetical protein [Cohnella herbarum]QJD84246.1 hypothetical protein HH215_14310 [Cohnella herbarum]
MQWEHLHQKSGILGAMDIQGVHFDQMGVVMGWSNIDGNLAIKDSIIRVLEKKPR